MLNNKGFPLKVVLSSFYESDKTLFKMIAMIQIHRYFTYYFLRHVHKGLYGKLLEQKKAN